jgi:hypothetical protein
MDFQLRQGREAEGPMPSAQVDITRPSDGELARIQAEARDAEGHRGELNSQGERST